MKFEWENIENNIDSRSGYGISRAKISGGWLIKDIYWHLEKGIHSQSMIFVPDPNHEWTIEKD